MKSCRELPKKSKPEPVCTKGKKREKKTNKKERKKKKRKSAILGKFGCVRDGAFAPNHSSIEPLRRIQTNVSRFP